MLTDMGISVIGIVLLVAAITLMLANLFLQPKSRDSGTVLAPTHSGPVFLFDADRLIDSNPAAKALLAAGPAVSDDWQQLMAFLSPRFAGVEAKLTQVSKLGSFSDVSHGKNGVATLLEVEYNGGLTKITLSDPDIIDGPGVGIAIAHRAATDELAILRDTISAAPILTWRENGDGEIVWANSPYMILAASTMPLGRDLSWPLPRLFDRSAGLQSSERQRQSVVIPGKPPAWFDLRTQPHGDALLCFATPADAAVASETSLREFMQTLSKTFAQLPIGLAIFDKGRKLQMFNPALVELTRLAPDFLSMRPSLLSVLDAMRERNLLPEPKDYQGWRRQIVEMERAAATGLFQENWALADGQTFRVTGRPHPNGALALMIEDISTEMQRTRRYRADLELGHSVIDQMPEAIVVFGQSGQVMWSNTAYAVLWGHDPNATLGEATIRSIRDHWKTLAAPSKIWVEMDEFVHTIGDRERWTTEVRLLDGRLLSCRITPVAAGATMIAFDVAGKKPQAHSPNADNDTRRAG